MRLVEKVSENEKLESTKLSIDVEIYFMFFSIFSIIYSQRDTKDV